MAYWDDRPPKIYESNFIHHDIVQLGKQHSPSIVLSFFRLLVCHSNDVKCIVLNFSYNSEPVMKLDQWRSKRGRGPRAALFQGRHFADKN